MNKKICIITGSNSGIGKQAAHQIMKEGYHVIMACRSEERGRAALDEIIAAGSGLSGELMLVDMGLKESVKAFATEFQKRYDVLDVLIHNAAIFDVSKKVKEKNAEGVETVWAVNHLGAVLLTELLLEPLKNSRQGRILTVSSQGLIAMPRLKVDLDDPEFNGKKFSIVKAYYQAKRAQVMYTYWLAERLKGTKITVNSIRVTAVKIDISRHPDLSAFMKWIYSFKSKRSLTPAQMAETYTYLAVSEDMAAITGKYFNEKQKEVKSVAYTYNRANQQAVMELTKRYLPEIAI